MIHLYNLITLQLYKLVNIIRKRKEISYLRLRIRFTSYFD